MLYLSNRVYLELDRYITNQGTVVIVGPHAEKALGDTSFNNSFKVADTKVTLEGVNLSDWIDSLCPTESDPRVTIFADMDNYVLLNAFSLSSILENPTVAAIKEIIDLDFQYIESESAYPSGFFESVLRNVNPPVFNIEQVVPIIEQAMSITPKMKNSTPRLELQFANYLTKTLSSELTTSLIRVANSIVKKTAWPGKDFTHLSNGLPALMKMTDGVDLENLEIADFKNYYPAYWKLWNISVPDTDNWEDLVAQDVINYLKQYEEHFGYSESEQVYQTVNDIFSTDPNGLYDLAKNDLLDPSQTFAYEGIKGRLLQKINALLWYKISANYQNPEYLAQFRLR
jgi:hypothetical protein